MREKLNGILYPVPRRGLLLGALPLLLAIEGAMKLESDPFVVRAAGDETAHEVTAFLMAMPLYGKLEDYLPVAFGAIVMDLDHIPMEMGIKPLRPKISCRPYTHNVLCAALVSVATWLLTRDHRAAAGVAAGIATHYFRDLATGGAPLLWPASTRCFRMPRWIYLGTLYACLVRKMYALRAGESS
ncbi:membrane-bound metal-dependent hydrolase [Thermobaculum terrenum ATCC BAA-798]|uniref:Membrane-bound metal-dependent hydrolase n=1 Tax=Thermobaculum terrenum (strain ATCC BAA-798 / CCMEE 7001 / YNP1) TaxID=525904 RepID=D1CHE8_THET1|nr:metal-dependent hydrolase [Thermobaculum terrenum]ACZ43169.1 membrane-bound metal-dependent hydrolase [Thermobaculum terrenum ATCC BAA-798]